MSREPDVTIEGPTEIDVVDRPALTGAIAAEQLTQTIERFAKDRVFINQPAVYDADDREADQ